MSESPQTLAESFVRAINIRDVDAICSLMTPEHRFIDSLGNVVEGREKMRAAWAGYFGIVPDYSIAVDETHCAGSVVVMLGEARGTYAPGGKLAPENHWKTPAAFRARIEAGKVAEWRVYADNEPIRQCVARGK